MPKTRFQPGDEVVVHATVTSAYFDERRAMMIYNLKVTGETADFNLPAIASDNVYPMIDSIATQSDDDAPLIQN